MRRRRARPLSPAPRVPGHCPGRGPSAAPRGQADLTGKRRRGVRRSRWWRRWQGRTRVDRWLLEPRNASSAATVGWRFGGRRSRCDPPATGGGRGGRGVPWEHGHAAGGGHGEMMEPRRSVSKCIEPQNRDSRPRKAMHCSQKTGLQKIFPEVRLANGLIVPFLTYEDKQARRNSPFSRSSHFLSRIFLEHA